MGLTQPHLQAGFETPPAVPEKGLPGPVGAVWNRTGKPEKGLPGPVGAVWNRTGKPKFERRNIDYA